VCVSVIWFIIYINQNYTCDCCNAFLVCLTGMTAAVNFSLNDARKRFKTLQLMERNSLI